MPNGHVLQDPHPSSPRPQNPFLLFKNPISPLASNSTAAMNINTIAAWPSLQCPKMISEAFCSLSWYCHMTHPRKSLPSRLLPPFKRSLRISLFALAGSPLSLHVMPLSLMARNYSTTMVSDLNRSEGKVRYIRFRPQYSAQRRAHPSLAQ
jgi:hypothetical protein